MCKRQLITDKGMPRRDLRNLQKEVAQGVEGALPCRLLDWEGGKVGIPERVDAILNQYPLVR